MRVYVIHEFSVCFKNYLITGQKYVSSGSDHEISLGVYDHMKRWCCAWKWGPSKIAGWCPIVRWLVHHIWSMTTVCWTILDYFTMFSLHVFPSCFPFMFWTFSCSDASLLLHQPRLMLSLLPAMFVATSKLAGGLSPKHLRPHNMGHGRRTGSTMGSI